VKLFSHGHAADYFASLKHEWFESGFSEIKGGDEAIVAGADDDNVVLSHENKSAAMNADKIDLTKTKTKLFNLF